jgi:hypothetical protein
MPRRLVIVVAALVVVAAGVTVALVAGDDDEKGGCGSGYPETPRCMAEAYALRTDASKCDLLEPEVLEEVVGIKGPGARERCAKLVGSRAAPKRFEILRVEEEEGDATGVEFLVDGRESGIVLRRMDGRWRIVELEKG